MMLGWYDSAANLIHEMQSRLKMLNVNGTQFTTEEVDQIENLAGLYEACKQKRQTQFQKTAFKGQLKNGNEFVKKMLQMAAIWEANPGNYRFDESSQDIFGDLLNRAKQSKQEATVAQNAARIEAQDKQLLRVEKKTNIGRNIVYMTVALLVLIFGVTTFRSCAHTPPDRNSSPENLHPK